MLIDFGYSILVMGALVSKDAITVSVIMPAFNDENFISESICSVISQSYVDWELIVVDDASSDNTVNYVESLAHADERIHLIRLKINSGSAVARNTGIKNARGRFIAFLDADDLWLPFKLEKQLSFMRSNGYPFVFSSYNKININGGVLTSVCVPSVVSYSSLLKTNSIGCLTAMYDTKFFGKVYMPNIRKRQDLGLWLDLIRRAKFAYGLNEILAQYRVRSGSVSANKLSAASYTWRLYRDVEKLNFFRSCYYFGHYAVRGIIRTKMPLLARKMGLL